MLVNFYVNMTLIVSAMIEENVFFGQINGTLKRSVCNLLIMGVVSIHTSFMHHAHDGVCKHSEHVCLETQGF